MSWGGTMTCNIENKTGGTITGVSFAHQWNGGVDQPIFNPNDPFTNNMVVPMTIHVGEGSSDDWTVRFTDADGNCWYRNEKQCDIEQEDLQSGKAVHAVLGPGKVGFSIKLPVSSSCLDNYYDSCNPSS
ncbi:MAG TPA: hypothetical protein VHU41_09285 [Thermoanaerobaculia bacterium]|nr:hypothetical protein [Thermoanaerobaculia bacterium]